ncbi:MAG: DUF3288 family protein [Prochlorococcaceae cyanobacterium]|jgi:hypothetical protein
MASEPAPSDAQEQSHPLHTLDRDTVDRLLAADPPADGDLVDAARLLMRYQGFPGARDIQDDLERVLRLWGLERQELHRRTRVLWQAGFRPGPVRGGEAVGSGFDTSDQDA